MKAPIAQSGALPPSWPKTFFLNLRSPLGRLTWTAALDFSDEFFRALLWCSLCVFMWIRDSSADWPVARACAFHALKSARSPLVFRTTRDAVFLHMKLEVALFGYLFLAPNTHVLRNVPRWGLWVYYTSRYTTRGIQQKYLLLEFL